MRPPYISAMMSPSSLNGTCTDFRPAAALNISAARCGELPMPPGRPLREQRGGEMGLADQRDGVAVGARPGDDGAADQAAGAGAVVHHDLLDPRVGQLLPEHTGQEVARRGW